MNRSSPQQRASAARGHRGIPQQRQVPSLAQVPSSDQPLASPGERCCTLSSGKGRQRTAPSSSARGHGSRFPSGRLVWSFTQIPFNQSLLGTACECTDNAKTCSALALAQGSWQLRPTLVTRCSKARPTTANTELRGNPHTPSCHRGHRQSTHSQG